MVVQRWERDLAAVRKGDAVRITKNYRPDIVADTSGLELEVTNDQATAMPWGLCVVVESKPRGRFIGWVPVSAMGKVVLS